MRPVRAQGGVAGRQTGSGIRGALAVVLQTEIAHGVTGE